MKRLTISQIALFLYFSALLFIYEIMAQYLHDLVIDPGTYFFIVTVILTISLVPAFRYIKLLSVVMVSTFIFVAYKLVIYNTFHTGSTVQFIIEYIALLLAIILIVENNHSIDEIKVKLEVFNVPKTKHQILSLSETTELIEQEFSRARRYNYPISIIKINLLQQDPGGHPKFEDPQQAFNRNLSYKQFSYSMIKILDGFIREFDQIVKIDDQKQLLIVCPETDLEHAKQLTNRLQEKKFDSIDFHPFMDVATFPQDGPTFRAVLSLMESRNP
jgi:hypothetical protein